MPVHVKKTLETVDCEEKEKRVGDGTHTKRRKKYLFVEHRLIENRLVVREDFQLGL